MAVELKITDVVLLSVDAVLLTTDEVLLSFELVSFCVKLSLTVKAEELLSVGFLPQPVKAKKVKTRAKTSALALMFLLIFLL